MSEDTWGPHRSEFHVELKPDANVDQSVAQEELRGILESYPGIQSEVVTFLGDRIGESLSGETAQVAVKIFGDDLDALDKSADKVTAALGKVKGIVDLQFKRQSGTPTIAIHLIPQALAATGLKVTDVLDTIEAAYAGSTVGQTFQGTRTVEVVALLPDKVRSQPTQVQNLMITSPLGPVPLSQVAHVEVTTDRYTIQHDSGQRLVVVTFNVSGRPLQDVVNKAQQLINHSVALPAGVYAQFTDAAEAELRTRNELILYSSLALVVIVMILFMSFHWRANSWLVLANLPFALIGSVFAIWVTGLGISLYVSFAFRATRSSPASLRSLKSAYTSGATGTDCTWFSDNNYRGITEYNGALYFTKGSGSNGMDTVYTVPSLPTVANAAAAQITVVPGFPTDSARSTGGNFTPFAVFFASPTTLYVTDEGTGSTVDATQHAGLQKWSLVSGTWQLDYVLTQGLIGQVDTNLFGYDGQYPDVTTSGLRNLTGTVNDDGTVTLWATTSTTSASTDNGADPNKVVQIVDKLSATTLTGSVVNETFHTVAGPTYGTVYRGVAYVPSECDGHGHDRDCGDHGHSH